MMKKILSLVLSVVLLLSTVSFVSAQQINDEKNGIAFSLSDNWISLRKDETSYLFQHKLSEEEGVGIYVTTGFPGYDIMLIAEDDLKSFCAEVYSDASISENLTLKNGVKVSVKTDSIVTNYETYNNTTYYRYEKAYTASAYGFYDTPFYTSLFLTVKNGNLYIVEYKRNTVSNHFADVVALLDSLSFQNGEIKILINGKRIYPDSAPVIYNDRTLVPIRAVAEEMGYNVGWNSEGQIVSLIAEDGSKTIHFIIGIPSYLINYENEYPIDVAPVIIGDRTYLPLRAVAEAIDAEVEWNGSTRTVEIHS